MTETRRQQINAAANRYFHRKATARAQAGLTTRGTARVYRRWETPGLPRHVRARMSRRYLTMADLMDRVAVVLVKAQEWLPAELRNESTVLARQLSTVKRHNKQRKVRIV
jgi:hypothetical protein